MTHIDLNADVGEGFDDEALLPWVTSANIACGGHAGDVETMARTVELCLAHGVSLGAHPGVPDRGNFGRLETAALPGQVGAWVREQVSALEAVVRIKGGRLRHLKLHGALYHLAARDEAAAAEVLSAAEDVDPGLVLVVPPGSVLGRLARVAGRNAACEGFPERGYRADGTLAPRAAPGAVIDDPAAAARRAVAMALNGSVLSLDGTPVPLAVETLCIHGDAPRAAAVALAIREALEESGVHVAASWTVGRGREEQGTGGCR